MGYPRHVQVPPDVPGIYHCVSRCVRRAMLCGEDAVTGRSFEHRKQWVEDRIFDLADTFAVAVHAYAVMDNHLHLVVETDPTAPARWNDAEVARRWARLSPATLEAVAPDEDRLAHLTADTERLGVLRERLGSLSWFMRFLKEPIARRANREDGCTGRFWEGRFRTQDLLDDPAVLACMVYVDLNPLRAGLAALPELGPHTSLRHRIHTRPGHGDLLQPVASSIRSQLPELSNESYLELVDWTGRQLHPGPHAAIDARAPAILERLAMPPAHWLAQVPVTETGFSRLIGRVDALLERARLTRRRWVRGIGTARALQRGASRARSNRQPGGI